MRCSVAIPACLAALGVADVAAAQDWPTRPVTMVIPFAAGGALDILGRILCPGLSESLGRSIVVARLKGTGTAKPLLLLHHMDVVPTDASRWQHDPFAAQIADGKIWGRGAMDMKSLGVAQFVTMLAMKRAKVPLKRDIIFLATADEEAGGLQGAGWFAKNHPELVANAEASSNLARYAGVRYGTRAEASTLHDVYYRSRARFGAEVKRRIMIGTFVLSAGYYDAYYFKAHQVRALIRRDYDRAFASVDVVAMPTSPTAAFRLGEKTEDPLQMYLGDVFTVAANLAGLPAISIPCGLTEARLPVGFQLTARPFDEATLLRAADALERRMPIRRPDAGSL